LALAAGLPVFLTGCATSTFKQPGVQQNWLEKTTSSVKSGSSKMVAAIAPKKNSYTDPTPPPSGKPGAGVFVAMAQMSERSENFDEAEAQYKKALDIEPNHLNALVGYAHLEDRRNNLEAATKLYQKAAKKHSKDASVHNDLGLCYHRRGSLDEATKSLRRAVELRGDNKLYRNNLAAVYVEQGKTKEALAQLTTAHGEAVGNYNLAFLLVQKHDNATALVHFRKAAEKDPSLVAARQWIAKLSGNSYEQQLGGGAAPPLGQQSYAPPVQNGANAAFANQPVSYEANAAQYPAQSPAAAYGVQYPQATRPGEPHQDATPPVPNGNRLPNVTPTSP
jgi:tetratricopeptide (TPR) repeat protein